MNNEYIPFLSEILEIIEHTEIEYTFRMSYEGDVKPGQFFEVSLPKFGEAPISVSGIGKGYVDLTIRRVGKVTNEIFKNYVGNKLFLRGPYGNGFDVNDYKGKELTVVAGGTGLSPVKAVVDYFADHREEAENVNLICGFKSTEDVLFKEDIKSWEEKINVTLTVDGLNLLFFSNDVNAASIVTGTIGTLALIASFKLPFLNGSVFPSKLLVPSGNIIIE